MRFFRSKSNFLFGSVLLVLVFLFEITIIISFSTAKTISISRIILMVLPLIIALFYFVAGFQTIKITPEKITLETLFIAVKELKWEEINQAGIGKIYINKNKFVRQLFVSQIKIEEHQIENLDKLRFNQQVIWFDFSLKAQEKLIYYLDLTK